LGSTRKFVEGINEFFLKSSTLQPHKYNKLQVLRLRRFSILLNMLKFYDIIQKTVRKIYSTIEEITQKTK